MTTRQEAIRRQQLEESGALQGMENAIGIAKMFADISRQATVAANERRLEAAERNIKVGTTQLELQRTDERRRIAQALARHSGIARVNAAVRGTSGGRSTEQLVVGNFGQAAQAVSVVAANTAFRIQQLINQNIVDLEDENIAALEGGLRGFATGMQIQSSLSSLATEHITPIRITSIGSRGEVRVSGGDTIFTTPSLDLGSLFAGGEFDFDQLLKV